GRSRHHLRILQSQIPVRSREPCELRGLTGASARVTFPEARASSTGCAMVRRLLALVLLLALGSLSACNTPPSREPFPKLTYGHLAPYRLTVGRVDVVDAYTPPMALPNVEQNFPISPAATAEQWGRDRLKAVGGPRRAVYTVLRADAVETHLAGDQGS